MSKEVPLSAPTLRSTPACNDGAIENAGLENDGPNSWAGKMTGRGEMSSEREKLFYRPRYLVCRFL